MINEQCGTRKSRLWKQKEFDNFAQTALRRTCHMQENQEQKGQKKHSIIVVAIVTAGIMNEPLLQGTSRYPKVSPNFGWIC